MWNGYGNGLCCVWEGFPLFSPDAFLAFCKQKMLLAKVRDSFYLSICVLSLFLLHNYLQCPHKVYAVSNTCFLEFSLISFVQGFVFIWDEPHPFKFKIIFGQFSWQFFLKGQTYYSSSGKIRSTDFLLSQAVAFKPIKAPQNKYISNSQSYIETKARTG